MTSTSDDADRPITHSERVDEFMALFTQHASWLRGYVVSLVPNLADADEILQNTNAVLWRKFGQFQPGSDFLSWGCRVAHNEVLHFRRGKARERLRFGDEFLDLVAQTSATMVDELSDLHIALDACLKKLSEKDRRLVEKRYRDGATMRSAASGLGRSIAAVYKALERARKSLMTCIERELGREDASS